VEDRVRGKSSRRAFWVNAVASALSAAIAAILIVSSFYEAADAARRRGHGGDIGAMACFVAVVYVAPAAVAFGATALAMRNGWRIRWVLQVVSLAWLIVCPFWM
jgi:hypothetical protein